MSNTFTKAAFTLLMRRDDAALLRTAQRAVDILDTNGDDANLAAGYDELTYHNTGDILAAARRSITKGIPTSDEFVAKLAAPRPGCDSYEEGYDPADALAAIITEARHIAGVTPAPDLPVVEP